MEYSFNYQDMYLSCIQNSSSLSNNKNSLFKGDDNNSVFSISDYLDFSYHTNNDYLLPNYDNSSIFNNNAITSNNEMQLGNNNCFNNQVSLTTKNKATYNKVNDNINSNYTTNNTVNIAQRSTKKILFKTQKIVPLDSIVISRNRNRAAARKHRNVKIDFYRDLSHENNILKLIVNKSYSNGHLNNYIKNNDKLSKLIISIINAKAKIRKTKQDPNTKYTYNNELSLNELNKIIKFNSTETEVINKTYVYKKQRIIKKNKSYAKRESLVVEKLSKEVEKLNSAQTSFSLLNSTNKEVGDDYLASNFNLANANIYFKHLNDTIDNASKLKNPPHNSNSNSNDNSNNLSKSNINNDNIDVITYKNNLEIQLKLLLTEYVSIMNHSGNQNANNIIENNPSCKNNINIITFPY